MTVLKTVAAALAAVMLTGCASSANVPDSSVNSAPEETTAAPEYEDNDDKLKPSGILPVISITTLNTDSLDFYTEPVAEHVARSISSWTPGYIMPPAPYYEECNVSLISENGDTIIDSADAQVKVRGNWTTTYAKKPLRIKFSEKQSTGINNDAPFKNWLLLAEYKDGSMLRDKAALTMAKGILGRDGLYSADAEFAEVVINGQYQGVYLLCDMQQTGSGRVDITEPEKDYQGTDIGYFLEYDGYFTNEDELHSFSISYADYAPLIPFDGKGGSGKTAAPKSGDEEVGYTVKSGIYSEEQHDFIASYLDNVYRIMYSAAYDDTAYVFSDDFSSISVSAEISPREAVERVVNTDSLADMYILSELTCDADIYWSSFFMDADFGEGGDKRLTFEAPWDFDSGLGNKDRCADGQGFYAGNIVTDVNGFGEYINPWLTVLLYQDWFQELIREKWNSAFENGVFSDTINMLENSSEEYASAFANNYRRWNNLIDNSDFRDELTRKAALCSTHPEAAGYLAEWLRSRVDYLDSQWGER